MQIEIVSRERTAVLEVAAEAPMWKLPAVIGRAYRDILEHLRRAGGEPAGAPFVRYFAVDWAGLEREGPFAAFLKILTRRWKMLIGFPVKAAVPGAGAIREGVVGQGRYVRAVHSGPYQKVGRTYKAILEYVRREDLRIRDESIEFYLNDPRTTPKSGLRTEVLVPLA